MGNVLIVSPTGSGKTVMMGALVEGMARRTAVIAHRHELVGQISRAVARFGVYHNIIAAENTTRFCIQKHIADHGRSFFDPKASVTVSSVDTLNARSDSLSQWANTIECWMIDEAHHVLADNKWGRAVSRFSNARGIGFTATPLRADRKALGRSQGGLFDEMVIGRNMRDLINEGSLCDYRIFAPPMSIDRDAIKVSSTGDFSGPSMRKEAHESKIVGDIVQHYVRIANGKRGITFAVDVEQANDIAKAYVAAGVPAVCVSAKTPDTVRDAVMQKFVAGTILQMVNVDLFGEGVDVPAVEVVSMGRPTESYGLYIQQFGRALRTIQGKTHGIIIDHVGNVKRHGLPDAPRVWSLTNEERGRRGERDPDTMPVTSCPQCFFAYEAVLSACPHCGHKPEPVARNGPQFVDGDLIELDAETLAAMRGEVEKIDAPCPIEATDPRSKAMIANWNTRQQEQRELRHAIAMWAGRRRDAGDSDSVIYRRFYHTFGVDVMSAQKLGAPEARKLKEQIQ